MALQPIDTQFRAAIGQGCRVISDQWSVYRLNGSSTGQIVQSSNLIIHPYQARVCFNTPHPLQDGVPLDILMYTGFCDPRRLVIGDVLVWTGPPLPNNADGRIFTLADVRPLMAPVFVRTEVLAYISRPHSAQFGDEPLLGDGGDINTTKANEAVCYLTNGVYGFSNEPGTTAATIPIGLHQHRRVGERQSVSSIWPTSTARATYYGYCPALNGVSLNPGDYISDSQGNRYELINIANWETGLQGWQFIAQSIFA